MLTKLFETTSRHAEPPCQNAKSIHGRSPPLSYTYHLKPSKKLPPLFPSPPPLDPPPGRYVTLGLFAIICAMSFCVSILRIMIKPSPLLATAFEIVSAASASPSARITFACLSCSAFSTIKRARSASCCAICLSSTALVNSLPNVRWVMETSSRAMLNSWARLRRSARMRLLTASRCVMSSAASN